MPKIFLSQKKIWSHRQQYLVRLRILNILQGIDDLLLYLK